MKNVLRLSPFLLGILTWILSGCSHTYPVAFGTDQVRGDTVTVDTFNRRLVNRDVIIVTRRGSEISASDVFLTRDSCLFADSTGGTFWPTADILTVRHVDHLSSTVGGLGLGFLGGFAVGMAVGIPMGSGIFAVGATVLGSVIGMIVGGVHGTINEYTMPETSPDSTGRRTEGRLPFDPDHGTSGSGANGS